MKEYQQRVVEEKKELDEKIIKLTSFIYSDEFNDVKPSEQSWLIHQLDLMQNYSDCLRSRINLFKPLTNE